MSLLINNYQNQINQDYFFKKRNNLDATNSIKNNSIIESNKIYPSLNTLKAYALIKPAISFGGLSPLEKRAQRLIIRNSKYPDEFKNDIVWALGLDKIIRQSTLQLKNNRFDNMEKLCSTIAQSYKELKNERDMQLTKEWLSKLSPRDRKITEHLYEVSFYPEKIDVQKINKFLALDIARRKKGEILPSYNQHSSIKEKIKYFFDGNRLKNGIDVYGTADYGEFRPINDSCGYGTIFAKDIEKEAGCRFWGRKFVNYLRLYENPEILKTLGEPQKIHIKNWESKNNPISAIISRRDLPADNNQHLLVYTLDKPSEIGHLPMTSTTVIFSQKDKEKPVLTSVIWKMPNPDKFPIIQKHLESLFSKYLKYKNMPLSEVKKEKIISITAEIQWYFHQMMPYKRGSAALGDALARILMEASGLELSRWKVDVMPDIETFVTGKKKFIQNYSQMFEKPPFFPKQNKELLNSKIT